MVSLCTIQQLPLDEVKNFVFINEIYGIQLAERLEQYITFLKESRASGGALDTKTAGDKGFAGDFLCLLEGNTLWAVIFASKAGLVLPCIPQKLPENIFREAVPVLSAWFLGKKVYCVSGWSRGVQLIREALRSCAARDREDFNRQEVEHRRYLFMCYDGRRCRRDLIPSLPITPCSLGDLESLYYLQSAYDTVEVLPKKYPFKAETCRANLQRILSLGNVVAIVSEEKTPSGKKFIAKANFSAVSWRFALIGGVYTVEPHRRKGCAGRLVQWMGDEAAKSLHQAVLFVREENLAARHSYENAGYFFSGNYEIVYY